MKTPVAITSRSILANQIFNLIQPGRIGGSEMQSNFRVIFEEFADSLCSVGGKIVEHDVNFSGPAGFPYQPG